MCGLILVRQEIISTKAADYSARFSAAVQMKNLVKKYWRPRLNSP